MLWSRLVEKRMWVTLNPPAFGGWWWWYLGRGISKLRYNNLQPMYMRASFVYLTGVQDEKYLWQGEMEGVRSVWEKTRDVGEEGKHDVLKLETFSEKGGRTEGWVIHTWSERHYYVLVASHFSHLFFWQLLCLWEDPWHNFLFCSCECLSVSLWWMLLVLLDWIPCSSSPRATRVSRSHVFSLGCQHHLHWLIQQGTENRLLFNCCVSPAVLLGM